MYKKGARTDSITTSVQFRKSSARTLPVFRCPSRRILVGHRTPLASPDFVVARNFGEMGDTTSGGDVDSKRVKVALLAAKSQYMRYSPRSRRNNLPASSWPPIQLGERPYGLIRRRRRRGRLKIERINVSQARNGETTYIERAYATQPLGSAPNRTYGIIRPRRRRGRIKIKPRNVSRALEIETTHLGRVIAMRSTRRPEKQTRRVNKLTFEYRMPGERWRDDEDHG